MKYTVITSFNQAGLDCYGQNMIDTFAAHWPADVEFIIYAENCCPKISRVNTQILDIHQCCPDLINFIQRHSDNPRHTGKIDKKGNLVQQGENFKLDAVRFSFKSYAITHAALTIDCDWLIWLDADVRTFNDIPMSLLLDTCPSGYYSSHLGRLNKFSETGYVTFNLRHQINQKFMQHWRQLYDNDQLFDLNEYHDAYVYTYLKDLYEQSHAIKFFNLTPPAVLTAKSARGHPFINSILGQYMDHLKGDRKKTGHSGVKQLINNLNIDYWKNQQRT